MNIDDAAVILHLRIELLPACESAFADYIRDAFPVFEATGGCRGAVYAREGERCFDEVFYYATEADYQAGERAIHNDPA